jgi:hypothetical protein
VLSLEDFAMQQRTRRLAFLVGATLLASIGLLAACSTDNGNTPLPGQTGDGGGRDSAKGDGSGNPDDDGSTPGPKDGGADCSAAPKPRSNGGVFCFGGEGSNDGGQCDPGENKICCADQKDPSTGMFVKAKCAVATPDTEGYQAGSCNFPPDAGGREWHCTESKHCPNSGEACCVVAGSGGQPQAQEDKKDFPGCGNFFNTDQGFFVGGSRCRANGCNAGELTLCSSDAECETGTCHFFKLANRFTGVCK